MPRQGEIDAEDDHDHQPQRPDLAHRTGHEIQHQVAGVEGDHEDRRGARRADGGMGVRGAEVRLEAAVGEPQRERPRGGAHGDSPGSAADLPARNQVRIGPRPLTSISPRATRS